ncbi:cilia- and flagella-associated protein 44-like isoform X2 [Glandiceps talaboti]
MEDDKQPNAEENTGEAAEGETAENGAATEQPDETPAETEEKAEEGGEKEAEAEDKPQEEGESGEKTEDVKEEVKDGGDEPTEEKTEETAQDGEKKEGDGEETKEEDTAQDGEKAADEEEGEKPSEEPQEGEPAAEDGEKAEEQPEGDKPAEEGEKPAEEQEGEQTTEEGEKPAEQDGEQAATEDGEKTEEPQEGEKAEDGDQPPTDQSEAAAEGQVTGEDQSDENKAAEGDAPAEESVEKKEGEEVPAAAEDGADEKTDEQKEETAEEKKEEAGKETEQKEGEAKPAEVGGQEVIGEDGEVQEPVAEEDKIPVDFYYNTEEHVSLAKATEESGLPQNLLSLHHSFGYDCKKRSNLQMLDPNTVIFAAGNIVEILNLQTKEQQYLRTSSGGGIGAIAVHPERTHFAVAEKGKEPNINIFEYPSLKLYRILRGGTENAYTFVDFNPSGALLASVGSDPDFMLTVWDWAQEHIVLRSKAFSQDVFRVTFSPENEGHMTTSGSGHIRFWKMAHTFTGLKLQGQLGKFGRTEISDIEGFVELPDGKVLSGTEWGNMLLWDGGLIKVQICRKNKKTCHGGNIEQFVMDEGELITIGADGFVRVWDFETIDTADSAEESGMFEMEPMNELKVGNDVSLRSMVKSVDPEAQSLWYAQDANGGIWKLDLSFSHTTKAPEKLFSYHAGQITSLAVSPNTHLVASTAADNTVRMYDYMSKCPLSQMKFNAGGSALTWVPQIIDPKGSTILVGFEDGVVRVLNVYKKDAGDKRQTQDTSAQILLKQVFKPHSKKVKAMVVDSKGEILATGGEDDTIFFFHVGDRFDPIGFVEISGAVNYMTWSPGSFDKNTLLVGCENGKVIEIEAPEPGTYDTSKTYQITGLEIKEYTFKSIKSRLRKEEEEARKAAEEEEKRKEEERLRQIRRERGIESDDEDEGDDDKKGYDEKAEDEEEEEEVLFVPEEPSPIHYCSYGTSQNSFWLSMGGYDAGYLYECAFITEQEREARLKAGEEDRIGDAKQSIAMNGTNDIPIRCMFFSPGRSQVLMGMEDGSVRIQMLEEAPQTNQLDLTKLTAYWALNIHDNQYGEITSLATSYDNQFVFSTGADGNFFVFDLMSEDKIEEAKKIARAKIPSARKGLDEEKRVDDIDNKEFYSIEMEKQKAEHDKMMREADDKKLGVKRTIAQLRRQFKKLLEKNKELPEHLQLDRKEFEMDPEIKAELEKHKQDKIELVKRELAWESEKLQIALDKLKNRFRDELETDRIVVVAVNTSHTVASLRCASLSEEFFKLKMEMETRKNTTLTEKGLSRDPTRELTGSAAKEAEAEEEGGVQTGQQDVKKTTLLTGRAGEKVAKALMRVEKAKQKRAARQAQWGQLYDSRPPDDFEDPADVQAIKQAQEHMGDYKLKTAKDYTVPEHLRMNAEKKRNQLLCLIEEIYKHKMQFNTKLIKLRNKKITIIEKIQHHIQQLMEVQSKLSPHQRIPLPKCPELFPCEVPEKEFQYTHESLNKFRDQMDKQRAEDQAKAAGASGFGTGFGSGFTAPTTGQPTGADQKTDMSTHPMSASPSVDKLRSTTSVGSTSASPSETDIELSPLEIQLMKAEEIRLLYQQDKLVAKIEEMIVHFDAELRLLRHDKLTLEIDLKSADLRHVTLFEELQLLKEFEKRENVLADKVEGKNREKGDMQSKVMDCQVKLDNKKKDIEKLQEKEKALYAQFQQSLGDNNKFAEFLTKVFKKKIKRAKKKAQTDAGSDSESESESEDESDWSSEDDESDGEALDDSVCPPGLEQEMFDNVCALREKRLDIEDAMAEEKRSHDGLKKELETLQKKAKIIDSSLRTAEADLEAFQLEKQQKLNELDVVVALKLHQVEHMVNGVVPQDLTHCLVFNCAGMFRLQRRIRELKDEKSAQRRHYKEHRQQHVRLIKDRKLMETKIGELEEKCNEMMMLKFGRIVDLEKLETVGVNRNIEELKEKLRINEFAHAEELLKLQEKIEAKKARITALTRDNTDKIEQLTLLLGESKELETQLDSRQKNLGGEFQGVRKADIRERHRLIQLVQLQAQEIDALKEEIGLLSRKGGHILPPTQPPLPHTATGSLGRPVTGSNP